MRGRYHVNDANHLCVGGSDAVQLARTYGTPLIVYDVDCIRRNVRAFKVAFQKHTAQPPCLSSFQVAYASKALSIAAIYEVMMQEGVSVDVVSGGELFTALRAGIPGEKIHFHGNNKSLDEIRFALSSGVGCFVVDNFEEIETLKRLSREVLGSNMDPHPRDSQKVRVLLRVSPGVVAHTHEHIATGQVDSKFGLDINSGQASQAFRLLRGEPHLQVVGLHCHIGSQIFSTEGHRLAVRRLLDLAVDWDLLAPAVRSDGDIVSSSHGDPKAGHAPFVLNVGGGFGIRYTDDDTPLPCAEFVDAIVDTVQAYIDGVNAKRRAEASSAYEDVPFPELWIEPGRSLVGEAGTTIYTVGTHKHIPGVRHYLSVDGGMSDNIRPVLYQAEYACALANRMRTPADEPEDTFTIVGKLCETGDMLIKNASLPANTQAGELLAVFCTGAYGYSMASNYNRTCRPAVVFVEEGRAPQLVVRRETYEDLVSHDLSYVNPESEPMTAGDDREAPSPSTK